MPPAYYMVAPEALAPWRRSVVVMDYNGYRFGSWALNDSLRLGSGWPRGDTEGGKPLRAVALAKADPKAAAFLRWARAVAAQACPN